MRWSEEDLTAYYARQQRVPSTTVPAVSEKTFQARVRRLARELGYRDFAVYDSRRSPQGWFDLALARPYDKLVLAELKTGSGKQSASQRDWFEDLRRIERVETYLWYPGDWERIVDVLRSRRS